MNEYLNWVNYCAPTCMCDNTLILLYFLDTVFLVYSTVVAVKVGGRTSGSDGHFLHHNWLDFYFY